MALEQGALFGARARAQHHPRIAAVQPRQRVAGGDEMAEQTEAVDVAGEEVDAAAVRKRAAVPIGAARRVEATAQLRIVGGDVGARIGVAEEAAERFVIRQMLEGAELEPAERDMGAVEIDGDDLGRVGGQIGEGVAAARGDGRDAIARAEAQRLEIDDRVFPDLRIDEAAEGGGEQALEHAGAAQRPAAMNRCAQAFAGGAPRGANGMLHTSSHPLKPGSSAGRRLA